jgi:hypothetical protein
MSIKGSKKNMPKKLVFIENPNYDPYRDDCSVDILALDSPSGKMSERAMQSAQKKLDEKFNKRGHWETIEEDPIGGEIRNLLRNAKQLEDLAKRGMKPRAYRKKALEYRKQAINLKGE